MYRNKSVVLNRNYLLELPVKTQIRNVTVTKNSIDTMIINVGGRTDIVNYYTPWLLNRLNGICIFKKSICRENVYKLSLKPEDVD